MKKSIVISILGGLMAAAPVMAANYDMYVTGSTAFRPNVFSATRGDGSRCWREFWRSAASGRTPSPDGSC